MTINNVYILKQNHLLKSLYFHFSFIEVTPPEIKVQDPKTCCKENKVSRYCLGLCSPVTSPAARTIQGKRLNLCSKYENVIEKCFLNAEMGMLKDTVKPRTLGGFGGHWTRSLGDFTNSILISSYICS